MQGKPFYVIGNWKSNKTVSEAVDWFKEFEILWKKIPLDTEKIKIILCPSAIHLTMLKSLIDLAHIPIMLGLQDISSFTSGAYTGQVSGEMVKNLVTYTLVGHSERRKYHHETDAELAQKVVQARENSIEPIYCVQDEKMFFPKEVQFVAYEPIWAIGTGKADTAENANCVAQSIQKKSPHTTVIYGGSVTADNVTSYAHQEYVGGVLPGGASLSPQTFFKLLHAASS